MKINCQKIFYIKLGEGGNWEKKCLIENPSMKIGFRGVDHQDCLNGNWQKIRDYYLKEEKKTESKASDHVRELKTFYESDESSIWITFSANKMWWCIPKFEFDVLPDNTKIRFLKSDWRDEDLNGKKLTIGDLSGKLTKTQAYRQTICSIEVIEYALRKINGLDTDEVIETKRAKQELISKVEQLIKSLTWKDFEVLIDLIFRQAGWQRLAQIGKQAKTIDLELLQPVTGEKCIIQIKSQSNNQEFKDWVEKFRDLTDYDKFFFVVHTEKGEINRNYSDKVQILKSFEIAELAVNSGLTDWIIKRN